jgi:hypothetical protein
LKRKILAVTFALALLFSSVATGLLLVEPGIANPIGYIFPREHDPIITINSDGTITPQTDLISRNGTTYTLTANVSDYMITIECSDIVFDGGGYTINLWNETDPAICVGFGPPGARNVTVMNVEVLSSETIKLLYCSYCQITGVKVNNCIDVGMSDHTNISQCVGTINLGWGAEYNRVFRNNITFLSVWAKTESNVFFENNFLCNASDWYLAGDCFWGNGSIGNYWTGYNGTDANRDGIGDTPYVLNSGNIDRYPLMYLYDIENDKIALSPPAPSQTLQQTRPFSIVLVAGVSALSVVVAVTGLIFYPKKKSRRTEKVDESF